MALRKLVEDDCGGSNSLIRLTRHFIDDHGRKEEGIQNVVKGSLPEAGELVEEFLGEQFPVPQTFRMDTLLQEMKEIDQNVLPPIQAPAIINELTGLDTAWANQYLESGRHFDEFHADNIWNDSMIPISDNASGHNEETHELGLHPKWAEEYLEHSVDVVETKNDEKTDTDVLEKNSENPLLAHSKFMKFMLQEDALPVDGDKVASAESNEIDEKWVEEFNVKQESPEEEVVAITNEETIEENAENAENVTASNWAEEFSKENDFSAESDNYESAFWSRLQNEWDKLSSSTELQTDHPWISEYEKFYDPFKEYQFNENNPMKTLSNALEEGKIRLTAGDLPSAVLCFEAAVQQDENNAEAWLLLGKTQAENEQDPLAISALKRCLSIDPSNDIALMALAVSYTNESYQNQACLTLKEWLMKNDKYKHLLSSSSNVIPRPKSNVSTVLFNDLHEEVKRLYIEAARINPLEQIDADVQCGLGVLFNLSSEYEKAADCFQAALQVRPDDSRLWNRLGATLANGQKSEEAVNAYHRALELSPGFIRARYNLGISCINLGAYKEAGEHLLIALNQQAAGKGIEGENVSPGAMSNTIWSTLRLVVSLMHKYHLNEAIENRDLPKLNKDFEIA